MKYPYLVIYRGESGKRVQERFQSPAEANDRLNALWGSFGARGPERHAEARAVLSHRYDLVGR